MRKKRAIEATVRMLLRPEYLNGPFGDPALLVWQTNEKDALLVDCGDVSRFSTKQLLKIRYLFLSHCHIDHFFGFDLLLRVHVGSEKTLFIFGPPQTSDRVAGKLQGYTWNLIRDQNLEFVVTDLNTSAGTKQITRFHARNGFLPSDRSTESWARESPVLDSATYRVNTVTLDHRTPSLAYSIEEKLTLSVNADLIRQKGWLPGAWLSELRKLYLSEKLLETTPILVSRLDGTTESLLASSLAAELLTIRPRHKIAYATDGAAHRENREKLLSLIQDADLFFSETCFVQEDQALADETKHFTATFIGDLAREARVKKLIPFHFSKRYLGNSDRVVEEVKSKYPGEVISLIDP